MEDKKKFLLYGALGAAIGGGLWYYFTQEESQKQKSRKNSIQINEEDYLNFEFTNEIKQGIEKVKEQLEKENQVGQISQDTLMRINDLIVLMMEKNYIGVLQKDRQIRREILEDLSEYVQWIQQQRHITESIMDKASQQILDQIGMSMQQYEMESKKVVQRYPQFEMMAIQKIEGLKMKAYPITQKDISKEQLIQCFLEQAKIYKELNLSKFSLDLESAMLVKMAYVSDYAGKYFNINDEDMYYNQSKLYDPEIQQAVQQLQYAMAMDQQQFM